MESYKTKMEEYKDKTVILEKQMYIQELEMYKTKTKMEEYKDETVISKRQMQEMRVSSGTRLLDLNNSTRCLQLRPDLDNSTKRQQQSAVTSLHQQ